jgi:hypothetical protein
VALTHWVSLTYLTTIIKCPLEIDRRTDITFWSDAIKKEMKNVCIAFNIFEDGSLPPQDYQFVHCHMVFDVKM